MENEEDKKKRISLGEKILLLATTQKVTTKDLAMKIYGDDGRQSCDYILTLISNLRKRGVDLYPDADGIWTLPKSNKELLANSQHKIRVHSTGSFRMIKTSMIAERNIKELKGSTQKLVDSITNIDDDETTKRESKEIEAR